MVKVTINVTTKKLPDLEDFANRFQKRGTQLITQQLVRNLQFNSPVRHGLLRRWAAHNVTDTGAIIRTPAEYAKYVNDGTGIYGPRGTPIYSRVIGEPFAFEAGGNMVFTRMIRGQKPQKFVEKSIEQTKDQIRGLVIKAVRESIE